MSDDFQNVAQSSQEKVAQEGLPQEEFIYDSIVGGWKQSLLKIVEAYDRIRPKQRFFRLKLFGFFVLTNISCYWLGIVTAFPFLLSSGKAQEYVLLQFPVGLMGACFDTLSFFVTIWIARNAIRTTQTWRFLLHLSLDLILAFLATMWVLLVFIVSGWVLSFILGIPEGLHDRSAVYQGRLLEALLRPFENIRNIYFGTIMGISAALPSIIHMGLFFYTLLRRFRTFFAKSPISSETYVEDSTQEPVQDSN